ncbi:MAG TPA: nucleoside-triphosphatase [Thermoanaerobaculales bacterium]|nr:nucleoside-triphosphatase [Thermoanaerobaculales bacterium]
MAKVFLIYGPRGAGKTSTTIRLADELSRRGIDVGGYFQRTTTDDLDRRGYDLVRFRDHTQTLPLARPGGVDKPGTSTVCSFSFSQEAFAAGIEWLKQDAPSSQVLVIDELGKLEARGEGHAQALRWALGLGDDKVLLQSVRGDMLFYVVENYGLEGRVAGYMEIPAAAEELAAQAEQLASMLG